MVNVISVRDLIGMVLRCGDIDNRFTSGNKRMQEGQEVHKALQSTYKEGWQKEVFFKIHIDTLDLTVQGRADGVFYDCGIHEIKSTRRDLDKSETEGDVLHWAQAYCYAHMLAKEKHLKEVEVVLTYFNALSNQRKDLHETKTAIWLEAYFDDLIKKYEVWHTFRQNWLCTSRESLRQMNFPFENYREGQRKLAAAVYTAVRDQFVMLAEAPTGVGKTMSTLFPTLKALGEDKADKVFYLTAKTVARTVAEEALIKLRRQGDTRIKCVTITAKDKICFTTEKKCNPEDCPYAKGHYDRVNGALLEALSEEDHMDRQAVEHYAKRHQVCPAELALDIALFSDVVIGDYNYAFDPLSRLQRFFLEVDERYVFLIDEAHNLPYRAREMFSASLKRSEIVALKKAYPKGSDPSKALEKLNRQMKSGEKNLEAEGLELACEKELDGKLLSTVGKAFEACMVYQNDTEGFELGTEDGERLLSCYRLSYLSDYYSEGHLWVQMTDGIEIRCIDPSEALKESYGNATATILFSATMAPYTYYEEMLGIRDCRKLVLESPFDSQNRLMLLGAGVDTRLKGREKSQSKIIGHLMAMLTSKVANYLIFCPSYDYLRQIEQDLAQALSQASITHQIFSQSQQMTEAERLDFLQQFEGESPYMRIGFAVLGGSFSEGIDLVGDRLEGVALIGFGTPYVSWENELIKSFFDDRGQNGFTYAYVYPAINKIVQAVGRLIRTETDRGMVLFLDDRYLHSRYKSLLPKNWRIERCQEPEVIYEKHLAFWHTI